MHTYPFKSVYTFANNFCGFCIDIVNVTWAHFRDILLMAVILATQRQPLIWHNN